MKMTSTGEVSLAMSASSSSLLAPISPGELLDKIAILEVKLARIHDPDKLTSIRTELKLLRLAAKDGIAEHLWDRLGPLLVGLYLVNGVIFDLLERQRQLDREGRFDQEFITLSRSVYIENDRRAALKRQIDDLLGSPIREEKHYPA